MRRRSMPRCSRAQRCRQSGRDRKPTIQRLPARAPLTAYRAPARPAQPVRPHRMQFGRRRCGRGCRSAPVTSVRDQSIRVRPDRLEAATRPIWPHSRPTFGPRSVRRSRPEIGPKKELAPQFRRTLVDYQTKEPAGTIIVDTPPTSTSTSCSATARRCARGRRSRRLHLVGYGTGHEMAEWPDWNPPEEMIVRQPYLPRFMAGGETNPLGARALYLGKTVSHPRHQSASTIGYLCLLGMHPVAR
jgi:hypothetical protein